MKARIGDDYRRNTMERLANDPEYCERWRIVQWRELRRFIECSDDRVGYAYWSGDLLTAMHDTMSDRVDCCGARIAKPIQRSNCSSAMIRNGLGPLNLMAALIAHPDSAVRSDLFKNAARKPSRSLRLVLRILPDLNQLKFQ